MLFHEAYAVATQELKTMAERPDEAGPRRLSQPERAERYRKIKASVSGIDIKDRNEPPDALLDLCISIYEGNRLRYVSWDRCTSKSQELSSEANRDNMLTVDPQGRLKGVGTGNGELACVVCSIGGGRPQVLSRACRQDACRISVLFCRHTFRQLL